MTTLQDRHCQSISILYISKLKLPEVHQPTKIWRLKCVLPGSCTGISFPLWGPWGHIVVSFNCQLDMTWNCLKREFLFKEYFINSLKISCNIFWSYSTTPNPPRYTPPPYLPNFMTTPTMSSLCLLKYSQVWGPSWIMVQPTISRTLKEIWLFFSQQL